MVCLKIAFWRLCFPYLCGFGPNVGWIYHKVGYADDGNVFLHRLLEPWIEKQMGGTL